MNQQPPELIWVGLLIFCYSTMLLLLRLFGASGLYVYLSIALIAANIQVLKAVQFTCFKHPIALGTVLFSTTFLCTDILTEYYSPQAARKAIGLGFFAFLIMTLLMILTLGFKPLSAETTGPEFSWSIGNQDHIAALFLPAPSLFISGMLAFLLSQLNDVWLYQLIRKKTQNKKLWLRNNLSTCVATLIDSVVFSLLAWKVFAIKPLSWNVILFTYILGDYFLRIILALADTPVVYIARYCLPREKSAQPRHLSESTLSDVHFASSCNINSIFTETETISHSR